MKKLALLLVLVAVSLVGYSQATPGKTIRVATRTTVWGSNLPTGTTIYCVADSTLWITKVAAAGTYTITTALAVAAPGILVSVTTAGSGVGINGSETFEAPHDSLSKTLTRFYACTLSTAARDTTGFTVSVNGVELPHTATGKYKVSPLAAKYVSIQVPIYQYDLISIQYTK